MSSINGGWLWPAERAVSWGILALAGAVVLCCGGDAGSAAVSPPPSATATRRPPSPAQLAEQRQRIRERRCDALCTRERECGLPGFGECPQRCSGDPRRDLDHVRVDFAWKLVACLEGVDCQNLVDGKAMEACASYARQMVSPSELLRRFCFESASRSAECGQQADQSECLDEYRFLDDPSLKSGLECLARPCAEVPGCFGRAFGFAP